MTNGKVIHTDPNTGAVTRWDINHYIEVMKARNKYSSESEDDEVKDHPLKGTRWYVKGMKIITIESVHRQWYAGWHLKAVYVTDEGSHGTVYVENINSISPSITKWVNDWWTRPKRQLNVD